MRVKDLIKQLKALEKQHGNLQVSITDGFEMVIYQGDFGVELYEGSDCKMIDIGIGGTKTDKEIY